MLRCRKCHQQSTGTGKICRACGGILEELPDEAPPADTRNGATAVSASASTTESEITDLAAEPAGPEDGDEATADAQPAGPAWKCKHCGEIVPGNFDVCWKCLTTKAGETSSDVQGMLATADEQEQGEEPDDNLSKPARHASQIHCRSCGSTKIMRDVDVVDHLEGLLRVMVLGSPDALVFKDRCYGEVRADICGECGLINFYAVNPTELYAHYRQ